MPEIIFTYQFFNITHDNESYAMVVVGISKVLEQIFLIGVERG